MTRSARIAAALFVALAAGIAAVAYLGLREDRADAASAPGDDAELAARGAYLARAANCRACHTARGGAPYAGGRAIRTPFGTLYAPNITPERETGIGTWSADDFWRALHNGKSKDGTLLYPAFPYPNYSRITRADADAMYAYFRTIEPVRQTNRTPALRFPFNQRALLVVWRAQYFRPGVYQPDAAQSAEWNRGAYLVQGPGHCNACHTPRNLLGATRPAAELGGALMPMRDWYAAALAGDAGGLGDWSAQDIADLLGTGVSMRGAASGPMAEVVRESLQHLAASDLRAVAGYLKSLPQGAPAATTQPASAAQEAMLERGAALYDTHCADCHKADGAGDLPHYPALAGNHALLLPVATNPIRALLHGGYPPSTSGNPRPYGMPAFGNLLSDQDAAAVLSFIRNAWGNHAPVVSANDVNRARAVALD